MNSQSGELYEQMTGLSEISLIDAFKAIDFVLENDINNVVAATGDRDRIQASLSLGYRSPEPKIVNADKTEIIKEKIPVTSRNIDPDVSADVAIIGLGGRYPHADNIDDFWNNLCNGIDCVDEIHNINWNSGRREQIRDTIVRQKKWGGMLQDIDLFDLSLFNISMREAELMDPQERIFLETAWEVFENAGYSQDRLSESKTGVYVGAMWTQYQILKNSSSVPASFISSIANRVSYVFNLKGPSIALDTMCSSSLTSVYMGYNAILGGECDLALCGGVNLSLQEQKYQFLNNAGFLSKDGRCRSFGHGGTGYVPGEGSGAILLKRLEDATRDNDHIYGIIKGIATRHSGKTSGYSVPSPKEQSLVIKEALERSGVEQERISYIEAHGTGTELGDPIEIQGLSRVYDKGNGSIAVGAVKSNIGHLESAAGIASITKTVLQLKNRKLVPSLHSTKLNKNIPLVDSPFFIPQNLREWSNPTEEPLCAGISSFGAGGTNVHLVMEQYIETECSVSNEGPFLFVLSAKHSTSLTKQVDILIDFFENNRDILLINEKSLATRIAYTLQVGRTELPCRMSIIYNSVSELLRKLKLSKSGSIERESISVSEYLPKSNGRKNPIKFQYPDSITRDNLKELAENWSKGLNYQWEDMYLLDKPRILPLPTYSFHKKRCWIDREDESPQDLAHFDIEESSLTLFGKGVSYNIHLSQDDPLIYDHSVKGEYVLAGAVYIHLLMQIMEQKAKNNNFTILDIKFYFPLHITDSTTLEVYLSGDLDIIEFHFRKENVVYASGRLSFIRTIIEKKAIAHQKCSNNRISKEDILGFCSKCRCPQKKYLKVSRLPINY